MARCCSSSRTTEAETCPPSGIETAELLALARAVPHFNPSNAQNTDRHNVNTKACTHKSRLFGNRWLPQTTWRLRRRMVSGDLPPPSPPAEKATAGQDHQTGQASTGD